MTELIEAVTSWPTLVLVLVVFGFGPGFVLRLLVLAYPRGNPRRRELIAELYAIPRIDRPLWVAEQLEVALFEGLPHRVSAALRRLTARAQTDERTEPDLARRQAIIGGFGGAGVMVGLVGGVVVGVGGFVAGFVGVYVCGIMGELVGRLVRVLVLTERFRSRRWPPR